MGGIWLCLAKEVEDVKKVKNVKGDDINVLGYLEFSKFTNSGIAF